MYLLEELFCKFESLEIGVCSVLARGVNNYANHNWNRCILPKLQKDVEKLNVGIQALTSRFRRCFFIDYGRLFLPANHLGRDGLHVNREVAFMLRTVIEAHLAEQHLRAAVISDAIFSTPLLPMPSLSPKMSYAEVLKLPANPDKPLESFDKVWSV